MNKRQKQVIQHQLTMENIVLKELEEEYKEALKDINLKIQMYQSMPETQSRIYHKQYQETLKKQIEAALEKLHSDEYTTINQYLHDSYIDAFVGTMYDIHGQGTPVIAPIDQNAAIKAVMTDTRLNKPLYAKLGVDVNKLKRTVSSEISRGIAAGMAYAEIARNIEFRTNAPFSRAKTIVRTEGHRIQQASAEDARQASKARGADVVKQWDSTMDGKTRETHRRLDGQIRETDEPFEMHGKKAMYPGDFGDPAEDCNCRCVALTRSRAALDADELATLKERAEFFKLDKSDSFNDFKKKYLKASETVENTGKSGIIEVELDELVPCLKDAKTGKLYDTTVRTIKDRNELRQYNKNNGWFINWNKVPADCTVSALSLKGNEVTQGLVAYKVDHENKAVFTHWVVSAPHNRGKDKQFTGVGGHLFAIMADASEKAGFGGFLYGQATSKEVLNYYIDKYGATPLDGLRFFIDEKAAHEKILDIYNFEREDE